MRLLICAGGTGGGVYPGLSVLQALEAEGESTGQAAGNALPGLDGWLSVLWVGGERGMEADLVKRENLPFKAIPAAGVHGVGMRALLGNLIQLAKGLQASRRILSEFRPEALLFTGGFVAVPMALAARFPLKGFPRPRSLVYVPDREPGLALKLVARFADVVAVTTEDSRAYFPRRSKVKVTGYPVRPSLKKVDRREACQAFGLSTEKPILLILGGSKGARSINRALLKNLQVILEEMQVIHISGQLDWDEVDEAMRGLPSGLAEGYRPFAYLHEEMGAAFSAADLVISRAGASTLGELPQFGLPALLAPYPHAWRYQQVNAEYLVQRGAAVRIKDADLASEFLPLVQSLMRDAARRERMRQAMSSLSNPGAARAIAKVLLQMEPG